MSSSKDDRIEQMYQPLHRRYVLVIYTSKQNMPRATTKPSSCSTQVDSQFAWHPNQPIASFVNRNSTPGATGEHGNKKKKIEPTLFFSKARQGGVPKTK